VQIESELIRSGQSPAVSIMSSGQVECSAAADFVQSLPAQSVALAEQSLVSAISSCPKQTLGPAQILLDTAIKQGVSAPRALLAAIDAVGAKTRWAQDSFEQQFSSLPKDYDKEAPRAPEFAALYQRMAPDAPKDTARKAGLEFLEWLSKVPDSGERNMAINAATGTMQQVLGDDGYSDALASNVVARDVAKRAGEPGEIKPPQEDNVSVLQSMTNPREDKTDDLEHLAPPLRARQAAADGFAASHAHDQKLADRYFDIAYPAAEEAWEQRSPEKGNNAVAVLEEVSEAAAQADPVAALQRAQRLQDPTASAISMLAVARVVLGQAK
jgi:hypothetical protein